MIRENLKAAIDKSGLVVKEVAVKSNVKKRTIDKWVSSVRNTGWAWELPPRITDIVHDLVVLDDRELDIIRGAVSAAVAGSKKGMGTEGAVR
ncbi:MAG: hypothetical protein LBB80_06305 [Treponema sp.]|jgi:hypothetical protein|nr:hypothetical protein [Treponema sp.]